jgi:glutamate racemase
MDHDSPIGVFDSGLGGLTVVRAVLEQLPGEDLVYLGDTARVPYGTRSAQTVIRYARGCARRLCEHGIKILVVACNTASAVALEMLRVELDIPVMGVIEPGARAGVRASRTGRIGVIGTAGTIASGAYDRAVAGADSRAEVFSVAAPLLVPLAEEGWTEGEVPSRVVRHYLEGLADSGLDAVVLGCTHYPLLRPVIESEVSRIFRGEIPVVDSARATADELATLLGEKNLASRRVGGGTLRVRVTDLPEHFTTVASRFLGRSLEEMEVEQIDL